MLLLMMLVLTIEVSPVECNIYFVHKLDNFTADVADVDGESK
jgi:hypothetical protein